MMGCTTTVKFDQVRLSPAPELAIPYYSNVDIWHPSDKLDERKKDKRPGKSNVINRLSNATFRKQALGVSLISHRCLKLSIRCTPVTHDWGNRGGCAVVLKPSKRAAASQHLLIKSSENTSARKPSHASLLDLKRCDHIFYTGFPKISKIVSEAAAKHLTLITLKLGGQILTLITTSADINLTSKHITTDC
ncbi:hypothetical protein BKA56DRAFT_665814 [Ilyonectria sp. MPI-CAGE-AT-0026]|nr:hypothetical protein BKA56DRAFT_665814 [Ilyonectria sp. MPI-CAGE-AT-0026]